MNPEGLMENSGGRGLPEKLPAGERVLWQGSPGWKTLARRAFHTRMVAAYFAAMVLWCLATSIHHGLPAQAILLSTAKLTGVSLVPLALIALYCWGLQRSTIYTITNRRVVMSFGVALPMTINLPFSRIEAAGLRRYANGTGDIPLRLLEGERVTYFIVWPHARPLSMLKPEPMLRCIPDVEKAASVLARALAAHTALTMSCESAGYLPASGSNAKAAREKATAPVFAGHSPQAA